MSKYQPPISSDWTPEERLMVISRIALNGTRVVDYNIEQPSELRARFEAIWFVSFQSAEFLEANRGAGVLAEYC